MTRLVEPGRIKRLLPLFSPRNDDLIYGNNICLPRANVCDIFYLTQDDKLSGDFISSKTISCLDDFH